MSQKSRKRKLDFVSPSKDGSRDSADDTTTQIDWTKCMFCQDVKTEKLVNPTESKLRSNCKQKFDRLEENLQKFEAKSIGDITVYKFCDVAQTFSETCLLHHSKFHKTCRNSFNNHHFQRAKKKLNSSAETPSEPSESCRKTTRSSFSSSNFQPTCIFCDSNDGCLRNASGFLFDRRVRQAAVLLGNDKLVAKLSEDEMPAIESIYSIPAAFVNFTAELRISKRVIATPTNML